MAKKPRKQGIQQAAEQPRGDKHKPTKAAGSGTTLPHSQAERVAAAFARMDLITDETDTDDRRWADVAEGLKRARAHQAPEPARD